MISVTNLSQVARDLDVWLVAVEDVALRTQKRLAARTFRYLVENSPQYSGDFVANWNVSINTPDTSFSKFAKAIREYNPDKTRKEGGNYIMGHRPAINEAYQFNRGKLDSLILGDKVYFTNASKHDSYYAPFIENNQIEFRPGNRGRPIAYAVTYVKDRFSRINKAALSTLEKESL